MILIDASVIIDYWKKPDSKVQRIIEDNEISICGVTIAELLHGAKNKSDSGF